MLRITGSFVALLLLMALGFVAESHAERGDDLTVLHQIEPFLTFDHQNEISLRGAIYAAAKQKERPHAGDDCFYTGWHSLSPCPAPLCFGLIHDDNFAVCRLVFGTLGDTDEAGA